MLGDLGYGLLRFKAFSLMEEKNQSVRSGFDFSVGVTVEARLGVQTYELAVGIFGGLGEGH